MKEQFPRVRYPRPAAAPWFRADLGGELLRNDLFSAPSIAGFINVWSGSTQTPKPAKVWLGAAWITKPVKRWTGAAWVTHLA